MTANKSALKGEVENVRVVIRIRPLNKKELSEQHRNIVQVDPEENVITLAKPGVVSEKPKSFKFDYIFRDDCCQVGIS